MKTGIYTITNLVTNHIYVGCTLQSFDIRWANHRRRLNAGTCNNVFLQRAWNKYGSGNFLFEELVLCGKETIYSEEHYWATLLNTHHRDYGYNLKPTHPENLSLTSEEARLKIKEKATGRKWSKEYKKLFRDTQLGRKHTKEHIDKAAKGKYKPVFQFTKEGVFIKEWESAITVSNTLNLNRNAISSCCIGRLKTSGGFIWKYKN